MQDGPGHRVWGGLATECRGVWALAAVLFVLAGVYLLGTATPGAGRAALAGARAALHWHAAQAAGALRAGAVAAAAVIGRLPTFGPPSESEPPRGQPFAPPSAPTVLHEAFDGLVCRNHSRGALEALNPSATCAPMWSALVPPGPQAFFAGSGATHCNRWERGRYHLTPSDATRNDADAKSTGTGMAADVPLLPLPELPTCRAGVDCMAPTDDGMFTDGTFLTWRPLPRRRSGGGRDPEAGTPSSASSHAGAAPSPAGRTGNATSGAGDVPVVFTSISRLQALRCLRGRRVGFVGDSMMRQIFNRMIAAFRQQPMIIEQYYHTSAFYAFNRTHDFFQVSDYISREVPAQRPGPEEVQLSYWFEGGGMLSAATFARHAPDDLVLMSSVGTLVNDSAAIISAIDDWLSADPNRRVVYVTQALGAGAAAGELSVPAPMSAIEALLADPGRACPVLPNSPDGAAYWDPAFKCPDVVGNRRQKYPDEAFTYRNQALRAAVASWTEAGRFASRPRQATPAPRPPAVPAPRPNGAPPAPLPVAGPPGRVALWDFARLFERHGGRAPYLRNEQDGLHFQCGWNRWAWEEANANHNDLRDLRLDELPAGRTSREPYDWLCWKGPPTKDCRDAVNLLNAQGVLNLLCTRYV